MKIQICKIMAGASLLVLATAARAETPASQADQPQAEETAGGETELVVTARRREESIQDVPQTVNVVTAEQVDKLNLRNFRDIQQIVPGLTLTSTNAFSNRATVRGVAFVPEASGNNPSVEFYLNDAPIASGFLFQSTFDFGQFELQRGPQGTLRGRAAPSGAIAVTVRRPDLSRVGVVANGTLSDLPARKFDGAINVPIVEDVLAIRVAGVIDHNRGNLVRTVKEQSDPANNRRPFSKTEALRGSIRFMPTDWIEANLMYQTLDTISHSHDQVVSDSLYSGAPRTTALIRPFDRLSLDDQGAYDHQNTKILIGNLDVRFAGQKLSYVGSQTKQKFGVIGGGDPADYFAPPRVATVPRVLADPTGFPSVCQNEMLKTGFTATTGAFFQCTQGGSTRRSHELRLASEERIAGIFDYVVGALYDHNTPASQLTQETPVLLPGPSILISRTAIQRPAESKEKSVFGNLTAHLGDFELSGGLRYISYKNFSGLVVGGTTLAADTAKSHATIYTASAKYQVTPDVMIYALTGTSWRPGATAIGNFSVGPTGTEGPSARERTFMNLPPERSQSYEIGAKTSFLDGRGHFNVSAYYQKFTNYPFRGAAIPFVSYGFVTGQPAPVASVATFNFLAAVPVEVKGVEVDASFRILDGWTISGNAAYSDGKIKNGTIACLDLDNNGVPDTNAATPTLAQLQAALAAGSNAGQRLGVCSGYNARSITTPKFTANIQTEYSFDITASVEGFVRGSASIYGKTANDESNTFDDVGAYGLLNMFAGFQSADGSWSVTAFAKNLLNERQILSVGQSALRASVRSPASPGGFVNYVSEYRSISVTAPREFGLNLRVALGSR